MIDRPGVVGMDNGCGGDDIAVVLRDDATCVSEIAEAFGTSINTVHARVRLIREKFQRLVQRERARHERTGGAPARRIGDEPHAGKRPGGRIPIEPAAHAR